MIIEILEKFFNWNSNNSRTEAKRRLKLIIAHDRTSLTPEMLNAMRKEIIAVVERYVEIDSEEIDICLESDKRMTALIANLPIRRVKPKLESDLVDNCEG